jgi:hypothetical protein
MLRSAKNPKNYFVLDIEPCSHQPLIEPKTAFQRIIERWPYTHSPHVHADAAFGGFDFFSFKAKVSTNNN